MPLTSRTLANLVGLNTEASPIDPTAMPPNSLLDCRNITFSKAGQVVARKGQPVYWDLYSATSPYTIRAISSASADETGDFYGFGQSASNGGQAFNLVSNGTFGEAVIAYYTGTLTSGVRTAASPTAAASPMDTANFASYTPKSWFSQNKMYASSKNGIFRQEPDGKLRRVTTPVPAITATSFPNTFSAEEAWLGTGYACRIVCVLVEYFEDGTFIESPISSEAVVENVSYASVPRVAVKVNCHNIRDLSRTYFEIYRTLSYKIGDPQEIEFKKCRAIPLDDSNIVISGDLAQNSIAILLPANDDLIRSSETLYASPNGDGGNYYVNCPPPAANDVTVFKEYTVYAGIKRPPFIQVTATGFGAGTPGTFEVKTTTAGTPTKVTTTLTTQANSTSDPSATGQMTFSPTNDYTFKGVRSAAVNLGIRPVSPVAPDTTKCVVPWYAKVGYKLYRKDATDGNIVRIKPTTGSFDLDRFTSPKGCFAVVESTGTNLIGAVRDIVTYDDYEQIPGTNGYIEFYGAQSKASFDATGSGCWDATSPTTTAATYYLYPLSTADTNNLPIYPISTDADGTNYDEAYSLLPTFYQYPSTPFMQTPVGIAGAISYDTSGDRIQCRPVFFGLLWKDVTQRLDRSVKALVQDHNTNRVYKSPYMVYTGEPFKFLVVGAFPGSHTLANTETNSGNYDAIFLNTASSSTFTYDENITSSSGSTNFSEDVNIPNGLVFSKRNRSECVPLSAILAPEKVGQDAYRIQRVAVNNDQLYVFKDKEGIFRVQIVEGTVVPQIAATSVVDNTVWLVGDDTLQELQESIYFLSNKGMIRLNNGQLVNISRAIESQIKDALSRESDTNNIKSFKNEFRRLYGIYFPTADKTFVYDTFTEQWSIWDAAFTTAYGMADGRLILAKDASLYNSSGTPVTGRVVVRDSYAGGGWDAAADQYDLSVAVTTPSTGNTAVFTSGAGATTYLNNIASISTMFDMAQDKVYYKVGAVYYPMTYVSVDAVAKTATFTMDDGINCPGLSGTLVIGVNSKIVLNRFWPSSTPGVTFDGQVMPSSPQGAMTFTQFSECVLHTIGTHTNIKVAFETDVSSIDFSSTVSPESYSVTLPAFYDTIRVGVPRNQARGRWIAVEIKHDYPLQKFTLAGVGWTFKDSNTYRMKARIN
jgi:hypothetical protein